MEKAKATLNGEVLTYPITLNYGKKDWTITSALREFLSNMLDTHEAYKLHHDGKFGYIEDFGTGLPRKAFILGESERDESQFGQFGEGLKMGIITMLREKRKMEVSTAGFNALPEVIQSETYDSNLVQLTFQQNDRTVGTAIKVECSQSEFEKACELFLTLHEPQRVDEGIYLPGGSIYVVGMKTTELPNMLFSYNLLDKTMTNRDRTIVDTTKLHTNMVKVLEKTKNQKFISAYLSSFQTNPTAYEYQLAFKPTYAEVWKKALTKLYPKVCLSSDIKNDLKAHVMGFTVLRNVPFHLLNIFKLLGCKGSDAYAGQYKEEGLAQKNKITYPMMESYVSDWTRVDAIREFIANALDAGDPRIVYNGTDARISDSGEGIMKKNLLLGGTSKANNQSSIGKFGEGLKLACLVLARTGSNVKIETVGTTYTAKLEHNKDFDTKLLVIEYQKNARSKGSSIVIECKESEIQAAKEKFIEFQGVRKKPTKQGDLEVFVAGEGRIYVNGLETAKRTAIFNYNILNKAALDSRDRNSVDDSFFRRLLQSFLIETKDEEIITRYLTDWRMSQRAIEYEINFYFTHNLAEWVKAAKKAYPKAAFASGSYDDSDFIVKRAGYELLSNVPSTLRTILEKAGVPNASALAPKFREQGIMLDGRIEYPISMNYGKEWTVVMGIKELIANALDADSSAKVTYDAEKKATIISDKGEGISTKHFIFGETDKSKDDSNIGLFGEGLKMAALVAVRNRRPFVVTTKGMRYEAKMERNTQFGVDMLIIHMEPSRKRIGTDIEFNSSDRECQAAKDNFLVFNSSYEELENGIYHYGGQNALFVNGCFVQTINSLYSYNLNSKDILNRDRKTVDHAKFLSELKAKWSMVKNKDIIAEYLTNHNQNYLEMTFSFKPFGTALAAWKAVVKKKFEKSCFASGTDHDGVARDKGFKLLGSMPNAISDMLFFLGVPTSQQAVKLRGDEKDVKKLATADQLTAVGKRRWNKAMKIFEKLYGSRLTKKIEIVEEFQTNPVDGVTLGLYNFETDMIYIWLELINTQEYSFAELIGTLIHEQTHRSTKAYDRTREFESGLTRELGRLAEMLG